MSADYTNGLDREELVVRFTAQTPNGDQATRYDLLRTSGQTFAAHVMAFAPPSREKSLALTKIEEAVMWANAAIAHREQLPAPE